MYIYEADTYCDSCGAELAYELTVAGLAPADPEDQASFDSNEFPKWVPQEETDGPDHCSRRSLCVGDAVCLADGSTIGELLSDGLTDDGVAYLREMLDDAHDLTPYQLALQAYWREVFADELLGGERVA